MVPSYQSTRTNLKLVDKGKKIKIKNNVKKIPLILILEEGAGDPWWVLVKKNPPPQKSSDKQGAAAGCCQETCF